MTSDHDALTRKTALVRTLTLVGYGCLLALFSLANLLGERGSLTLWIVQCLPLLLVLPGLWQGGHRAYSWLCFVVLVYFTWAVTDVMSPVASWVGWLVLALSTVVFTSAMMASRWRQRLNLLPQGTDEP